MEHIENILKGGVMFSSLKKIQSNMVSPKVSAIAENSIILGKNDFGLSHLNYSYWFSPMATVKNKWH